MEGLLIREGTSYLREINLCIPHFTWVFLIPIMSKIFILLLPVVKTHFRGQNISFLIQTCSMQELNVFRQMHINQKARGTGICSTASVIYPRTVCSHDQGTWPEVVSTSLTMEVTSVLLNFQLPLQKGI